MHHVHKVVLTFLLVIQVSIVFAEEAQPIFEERQKEIQGNVSEITSALGSQFQAGADVGQTQLEKDLTAAFGIGDPSARSAAVAAVLRNTSLTSNQLAKINGVLAKTNSPLLTTGGQGGEKKPEGKKEAKAKGGGGGGGGAGKGAGGGDGAKNAGGAKAGGGQGQGQAGGGDKAKSGGDTAKAPAAATQPESKIAVANMSPGQVTESNVNALSAALVAMATGKTAASVALFDAVYAKQSLDDSLKILKIEGKNAATSAASDKLVSAGTASAGSPGNPGYMYRGIASDVAGGSTPAKRLMLAEKPAAQERALVTDGEMRTSVEAPVSDAPMKMSTHVKQ